MAKNKYYAVKVGRKSNVIVNTWAECQELTDGFPKAKYCGFSTIEDAEAYLVADKPKVADKGCTAHKTVCEAKCELQVDGLCTRKTVYINKDGHCSNF